MAFPCLISLSRSSLSRGFAGLDHLYANEAVTGILPDDFILVADFANREFAFRRHDDEISPRSHGNQSIVSDRDGGETLDLAVVGFLAPCFRKSRIALKIESIAVAAPRDDDFQCRMLGIESGHEAEHIEFEALDHADL